MLDHELLMALETLCKLYEVSQCHQVGAGIDALVGPLGKSLFEYLQVPGLPPCDSFPGSTVHRVDHSSWSLMKSDSAAAWRRQRSASFVITGTLCALYGAFVDTRHLDALLNDGTSPGA